jgi:acetylornithine/succinyldiaminopimelate/putrescine aminotransferase
VLFRSPAAHITALREQGLLVVAAGNNVIRFLPPLIATPDELAQSVAIFRTVLLAKA